MIRKIQAFDYDSFRTVLSGKVFPLKTFFGLVESRQITPHKGTVSEVLIDGECTNILIENWDMYQVDDDCEIMSLRNFESIEGKKEIAWIEKK